MPRNIETQTTFKVELTDGEADKLSDGGRVVLDLPHGDSVILYGGETSRNPESEATPEDIEKLVAESEAETPSPKGSDPDGETENPHAGGIIDVERSGE